ncbi:T9SS type A sorting domain-containing protein [Thermophagus sp. OGC60D27]|uniref:T9SS type A sorting domain-containing protein n=1 Tax=Thermophagus sp. OGC60D27 TaxID=3458415 RepID=UPI0040376733
MNENIRGNLKENILRGGILLGFLFINFFSPAQLQVGDPGVLVDTQKLDDDYPQMERWANAGVRGGIPFVEDFDKVEKISSGNSSHISEAIQDMASSLNGDEKGLIILERGTYVIDETIKMKSNVSLIGEDQDEVVCSITMFGGVAFSFWGVHNCGIYNLTIKGSWPEPKYNWNYSLEENEEFDNDNISVKLSGGSTDCWLDRVVILNSGNDPLRCAADHNTFRNLIVDGCKRKAGGAQGYFFIQGRDNLITGCQVTHLRHISLQGSNVEYNVVYDNDFRQEISFHSGDAGNNLIENNRITLPVDMPPVAPGDADEVTPVEARNNKPVYFAIMGPWSIQHEVSENPNFIYRNSCVQYNHDFGSRTPWSDPNKVYYGPQFLGLSNQQRMENFPEYSAGPPSGGTLYAIKLSDEVTVDKEAVSDEKCVVFPNPFRQNLFIDAGDDLLTKVSLVNLKGVPVYSLDVNQQSRLNLSLVDKMGEGFYVLKVEKLNGMEIMKVAKVK